MPKIFVSGASGNVGRTIIRSITTTDDLTLVGGWCLEGGSDLGALAGMPPIGIKASATLAAGLSETKPDIVIDFTHTDLLRENLTTYLERNLDVVVGTTGLTDEQLEPFAAEVSKRGLRWAVIPNYGLGITLVRDFIKTARKFYPYVSIVDRHPATMANAPSGTAADLAHVASSEPIGACTSRESYEGVLGGRIEGVQVLSQRMPWPGPYSEHEITLAREDEVIRVTVEDHSSEIYMDGLFLTARKLASLPPGSFVRTLSEVMAFNPR